MSVELRPGVMRVKRDGELVDVGMMLAEPGMAALEERMDAAEEGLREQKEDVALLQANDSEQDERISALEERPSDDGLTERVELLEEAAEDALFKRIKLNTSDRIVMLGEVIPSAELVSGHIIVNGKNLFSGVEIGTINTTGREDWSTTQLRTGFIPVVGGYKLTASKSVSTGGMYYFLYDSSKTFLRYVDGNGIKNVIDLPAECAFVRFRFNTINETAVSDMMIEYGDNRTEYEPYSEPIEYTALADVKLHPFGTVYVLSDSVELNAYERIKQTDVQINGTSIVENGVANFPNAASASNYGKLGVVKIRTGTGIGRMNSDDSLAVVAASDSQIGSRANNYPIDPAHLNTAVKASLTDSNRIELTDDEKALACDTLGAESDQWKLIDTIDWDATTNITKTAEPDGTPYKFKKMMLIFDTQGNNTNKSLSIRCGYNHYSTCARVLLYQPFISTSVNRSMAVFEKCGDILTCTSTQPRSDSTNLSAMYCNPPFEIGSNLIDYVLISGDSLYSPNGNTIKIYAVRA